MKRRLSSVLCTFLCGVITSHSLWAQTPSASAAPARASDSVVRTAAVPAPAASPTNASLPVSAPAPTLQTTAVGPASAAPLMAPGTPVASSPATPVLFPKARVEKEPRWGLIGGGVTLFAISYLGTVIPTAVAQQKCQEGSWDTTLFAACADPLQSSAGVDPNKYLYIPIAGPFIRMADTDNKIAQLLYGVSGSLQATGVFLTILGASWWKQVPVGEHNMVQVRLTPVATGRETGLLLAGRF